MEIWTEFDIRVKSEKRTEVINMCTEEHSLVFVYWSLIWAFKWSWSLKIISFSRPSYISLQFLFRDSWYTFFLVKITPVGMFQILPLLENRKNGFCTPEWNTVWEKQGSFVIRDLTSDRYERNQFKNNQLGYRLERFLMNHGASWEHQNTCSCGC